MGRRVFFSIVVLVLLAGISRGGFKLATLHTVLVTAAPTSLTPSQVHVENGKNYLAAHNILAARTEFCNAVQDDSTNQEAQLLYGLTRVFAVYEDGQSVNTSGLDSVREILTLSGFIFNTFGVYDTDGTKPHRFSSSTPSTGAVIDFLIGNLLPQVDGAIANMSAVSSQSFSSSVLPAAVDKQSGGPISIDYADVQMIKALLYALKCNLELVRVYGLNVNLPTFQGSEAKQLMNYKQLFQNDATLLAPKDASRLPFARTALVNFIDTYTSAAGYILARSVPDNHLFVVDIPLSNAPVTSSNSGLNRIKKALAEIKASLSGPTLYTFAGSGSERNRYVNLVPFFNSSPINFRGMIANCSNHTVLSDTTLGGLFPMGLEGLDKATLRFDGDVLGVMCTGQEKPFALISPSSAYFSDYFSYGYKSTPRTVTVENIGTAPLQVSTPILTGPDSADFAILQDNCPSTLAPKSSCTVRLNFQPASMGEKNAELLVQTNDADAPYTYTQLQGYFDGKPLLGGVSNKLFIVGEPNYAGTMYAGIYGSGIFMSSNSGQGWTSLSSGLGNLYVLSFAVDSTNPLVLYVGTYGGGVFKSINGGSSWLAMNNGISFPYIYTLAVSKTSPQNVYAGTNGGLFRSSNGGSTWGSVGTGILPDEIRKVLVDPNNADTVYVMGGYDSLYKTVDGGATWTNIVSALPQNYGIVDMIIDPSSSSTLYLATYSGLYKSINAGSTWVVSYSGYGISGVSVSPAQPSTIYINTFGGVFRSTNSGSGWSQMSSGYSGNGIVADLFASGRVYSSDYSGSLMISADGGASWSSLSINGTNSNATIQTFAIDPNNTQVIYAGSTTGSIRKSTDGGDTWSSCPLSNNSVTNIAIAPTNSSTIYAVAGGSIYTSSNGGGIWSASTNPPAYVYSLTISPSSSTMLYACTSAGVYQSSNGGANWNLTGLAQSAFRLVISQSPPAVMYAVTNSAVYRSGDGGANWEPINNGLSSPYINTISVDTANSLIVYLGTSNGVYKSVNGGYNWSYSSNNMMNSWGWTPGVYSIAINQGSPSSLYVGTDYGVYQSSDSGASWIHLDAGGTSRIGVLSLPTTSSQYLIALGDNGIYKVSLPQSQVDSWLVRYTRAGTGTGTVSLSTGETFADPFATYVADGTDAVLSAQPGPNSVFAGWSGCDSLTSENKCKVTVHSAKDITATFNLDSRPLTVVPSPASGTYAAPLSVSLIANKDAAIYYTVDNSTPTTSSTRYTAPLQFLGNTTLKFIGVVGNEVSAVATENYAVSIPMYSLAVTFTGGGYGSVHSSPTGISMTGGTESFQFAGGAQVDLYQLPQATSLFYAWSGACSGADTCTVTMDDNKLVIADFRLLPLIRLASAPSVYYPTLQDALNAAHSGDTIQVRTYDFSGNLLLNSGLILSFRGGLDPSFLNYSGTTSLDGTLTIGSGSLVVDRLTIK